MTESSRDRCWVGNDGGGVKRGFAPARGVALGLVALWLLLLAGCGGSDDRSDAEVPERAPNGAESTTAVPEPRVVAIAPSAVEQLYALGLGDHLVGVGDYATWPEEVAGLPKLGGLYDFRLERIVELEPDLAVLLTSEVALRERLESLGIEVLVVPSETLRDVDAAMRTIAQRFDLGEAGVESVERWRAMFPLVTEPAGVDAMVTIGRDPGALGSILVAGPETFLAELLYLLGVGNAFADSATRYPQVGLDVVLDRAPDVILELRAEALDDEARARAQQDWASVDADWAAERCVVSIEGSHTLLAGPRLPQLYGEMKRAIEGCRAE